MQLHALRREHQDLDPPVTRRRPPEDQHTALQPVGQPRRALVGIGGLLTVMTETASSILDNVVVSASTVVATTAGVDDRVVGEDGVPLNPRLRKVSS